MRVLIVEDHHLFAEAFGLCLREKGIDVIAVCSGAADAVPLARQTEPDVALVDIGLVGESGLVVGQKLLDACPRTRIVALTGLDEETLPRRVMAAGWSGYLTKDAPVGQLVRSIEAIAEGKIVLSRALTSQEKRAGAQGADHVALLAKHLTARELDVLGLLVEGRSGYGIAAALGISHQTARTHIQNVLTKLQVHSRLEAAVFATRHNLLDGHRRLPNARSEPAG